MCHFINLEHNLLPSSRTLNSVKNETNLCRIGRYRRPTPLPFLRILQHVQQSRWPSRRARRKICQRTIGLPA